MQDMETKVTKAELYARQKWTLEQKIDHSLGVIEAFVNRMGGLDKVYLSFSGGKDSTVLSHLARRLYPDILHVFVNTGNEWPEVLQFIAKCEKEGVNIKRLRPKMTPRQVWDKYGFPLVSKAQSRYIDLINRSEGETKEKHIKTYTQNPNSKFQISKRWRYLLFEPYDVSHYCCVALKKEPAHKFERITGRSPITGVMASESLVRAQDYINRGGCNVFNINGLSTSQPLSIWLEDDIWAYIEKFGIDIAEVYHKGTSRTGCVGCGFGCQFNDDHRFDLLYSLHPKYYQMIMNYTNNGVTYREAVRKLLAVVGKTLPDENIFS